MKIQRKSKLMKFSNFITKFGLLTIMICAHAAHASMASTDFIQQIVDGHSFRKENIHGSQINILESTAYQQNYLLHLRQRLNVRALEIARPYIQEQDRLVSLVEEGVATTDQVNRLEQVQQEIETIRSRENVLKLYGEIKEYEDQNMDFFCYDNNKTTLRLVKNNEFDIRCIDNESAQRIVDVATNDPQSAKDLSVQTSEAIAPQPEGKIYYCYNRNKRILSKANTCNLERHYLTDEELEKVGRSNCYPISQSYQYKKEDGFTPVSELYEKCTDEICTQPSEQINFKDFELISFAQSQTSQCTADNSKSRVCAQTYTCQNKTYQVTCQFDEEESNGNNKCNVKSINEDTIMNKCTIIELGTEV